ncbi:MAG: hypothetical protein ACOX0S_03705 [Paludibacteraceae bacterium]|jgi:hypothetical protein
MNKSVIKKINTFNESPKYITRVSNVNDRRRMFDIAIEVYRTNESVEDTKEYLEANLSTDFLYRSDVLKDCKDCLDLIPDFLNYYENR